MVKTGMACAYLDKKKNVVCSSVCIVDKDTKTMYESEMIFTKDFRNVDRYTDAIHNFFKGVSSIEYMCLPVEEAICKDCGKYENIQVPWVGEINYGEV